MNTTTNGAIGPQVGALLTDKINILLKQISEVEQIIGYSNKEVSEDAPKSSNKFDRLYESLSDAVSRMDGIITQVSKL